MLVGRPSVRDVLCRPTTFVRLFFFHFFFSESRLDNFFLSFYLRAEILEKRKEKKSVRAAISKKWTRSATRTSRNWATNWTEWSHSQFVWPFLDYISSWEERDVWRQRQRNAGNEVPWPGQPLAHIFLSSLICGIRPCRVAVHFVQSFHDLAWLPTN